MSAFGSIGGDRPPKPSDKAVFTAIYDGVEGEVVIDSFGVAEAIQVRQGMVEEAVRHAAVVELERLGYRVLPPEVVYGLWKGVQS